MTEYIERGRLQTAIQKGCKPWGYDYYRYVMGWGDCLTRVRDMVRKAPAADVAPVVHSYWESYDCSQYMGTDEYGEPKWRDGKFYVCHNHRCRRKTVVKSHYCPNCGARMDGGEDE